MKLKCFASHFLQKALLSALSKLIYISVCLYVFVCLFLLSPPVNELWMLNNSFSIMNIPWRTSMTYINYMSIEECSHELEHGQAVQCRQTNRSNVQLNNIQLCWKMLKRNLVVFWLCSSHVYNQNQNFQILK